MAMLDMQQYRFFSGHYSTRDSNLNGSTDVWPSKSGHDNVVGNGQPYNCFPESPSSNQQESGNDGNIWPSGSVNDNMVRNGQPYNCFPQSLSPNQCSVYRETVRQQTMIKQEESMYNRCVTLQQSPDQQHLVLNQMVRQTTMLQLEESMYKHRVTLQQSPDQHLVFNQMVKHTMLQQESVFKDQVHALHRLYNRQREMLDEARMRQLNTYHPQLEMLHSNPTFLQFSCNQKKKVCQVAALPWLLHASSQSSFSAARNNNLIIDLNHNSEGEVTTSDVRDLAQSEGHIKKEVEVLPSKFRRYGKKILDLELPAEEYIDGEERVPLLALEDEEYLKEIDVVRSDTESSFGVMDLNLEYKEVEMFQAFPCKKSECFADLNESVQLGDEAVSQSAIWQQSLEIPAHGCMHTDERISEVKDCVEPYVGISDLNYAPEDDDVFEDGRSKQLADLNESSKLEDDMSDVECCGPSQQSENQIGIVDSTLLGEQAELTDKEGSHWSCSTSDVKDKETEQELPSNNGGAGEISRDSNPLLSGEMTSTLSEDTEQLQQVLPSAQMVAVRRVGRPRKERTGSTSFLIAKPQHTSARHNHYTMKFPKIVQALPCEKSHLYLAESSRLKQKRKSTWRSSSPNTDNGFKDARSCSKKSMRGSVDWSSRDIDIKPSNFQAIERITSTTIEDESSSTPNSSLSREVHVEAAPKRCWENMEAFLHVNGKSKENLPLDLLLAEPARGAAEALVYISSQVNSCEPEILHVESLYCLASIAACVTDDPEAEYGLSLAREGGDDQENSCNCLISDEADYFEAMTLKLPELVKEEHYYNNANIRTEGEEHLVIESATQQQARKGRTRRGRTHKTDFQNEVLPCLVSLSRHEVTQDLQVIGGRFSSIPLTALCRSNAVSKNAIRNEMATGATGSKGKKRERNRLCASASNIEHCALSAEGWAIEWGKGAKQRRGKRRRRDLCQICAMDDAECFGMIGNGEGSQAARVQKRQEHIEGYFAYFWC